MKKRYLTLTIVIIIILIIITIICIYKSNLNDLFENKNVTEISVNYNSQSKTTEKLKNYVNNQKYTIDNPKIISDPYGTSPLTAIAFFTTKDKKEINLYINDIYVTKMEKSTYHVIPIYGLIANYNNKVTFEIDNIKYDYYIKNDEKNLFENSTYKLKYAPEKYLIINSKSGKYAVDNNKNLVWFTTNDSMDISFINSYQYLIADNTNRVIKTDLLGQIYDIYYDFVHEENHKIKYYDNNMIITTPDYHLKSVNLDNGKIKFDIDIDKIFTSVDNNFASIKKKYSNSNLYVLYHMNNYEYNKEDNTILLSFRGLDAIVNYDITNEKILWLFSDNELFNENFDKYKLNLTKGKYTYGQHTPSLIGNKLYVYDNNFKSDNKDNNKTARAVIYEIDDMNIKEIYAYDTKYSYSAFGGSFYEEDNIKHINLGRVSSNNDVSVIELDENNKVITKFNLTESNISTTYSSFRQKFYEEETKNYELINTEKINIEKNNGKFITLSTINKFKKANLDESLVLYYNGSMRLSSSNNCTIYFVKDNGKVYQLKIRKSQADDNIKSYLTTLKGKFAIYIKLDDNDIIYNTNKVINVK